MLALAGKASKLKHALVAYDGDQRTDIVLRMASYLYKAWGIKLSIIFVGSDAKEQENVKDYCQKFLAERSVQATVISREGDIVSQIISSANQLNADFLITGSYAHIKPLELFLGGILNKLLEETELPMLICK